jgi:ligand-binding sensor domain-containing protein
VGANGYGVNRYDSKTSRFETLRRPADPTSRWDGFSIRAIFEDASGILWLSAGVLYRYDRRTRTLISFEGPSLRPSDFGNTGVWSIEQDRSGQLWFGSYEGLYRYDPMPSPAPSRPSTVRAPGAT